MVLLMSQSTPVSANFYDADTYPTVESVGYLMKLAIAGMRQTVDKELLPSGLTDAQWMPLFKIYTGHATTVAELARHCSCDPAAVTRMIDRLEAKDLCKRVRSQEDRRVVHIELTDHGKEVASLIPKALTKVLNACLAGFSHEEWVILKGLLKRLVDNTQQVEAIMNQTNKETSI